MEKSYFAVDMSQSGAGLDVGSAPDVAFKLVLDATACAVFRERQAHTWPFV